MQITKIINLDHISTNHLYSGQNGLIYLDQDEWQQAITMLDDELSEKMNALLTKGYQIINHQKNGIIITTIPFFSI